MIAYIDGKITQLTPAYVLIETNGLGYHVNISLNTYSQLQGKERFKLLTILLVKEDSQTLYGFATEMERVLFQHLISVNGVGAGIARLILSGMLPEEARKAIILDDERAFGKVKGVGPKTAKRIIIDLKDKLMKDSPEVVSSEMVTQNDIQSEAASALIALGFQRNVVDKTLQQIMREQQDLSLEQLVKSALRAMSG